MVLSRYILLQCPYSTVMVLVQSLPQLFTYVSMTSGCMPYGAFSIGPKCRKKFCAFTHTHVHCILSTCIIYTYPYIHVYICHIHCTCTLHVHVHDQRDNKATQYNDTQYTNDRAASGGT